MPKIKFNKKIIIGIIVFFIIIASVAVGYFYFTRSYKIFYQDGISFLYPKEFKFNINHITSNGLYKEHRMGGSQVIGWQRSFIYLYTPIKNAKKKKNLSINFGPGIVPLIKPIVINGLKGKFITYYLNEQSPSDMPVKGNITNIYLSSRYPNSTINLHYYRSDADHSLDKTWNMILKTLNASNQGNPASFFKTILLYAKNKI